MFIINGKFIIYGYQYKKQIKVFDAINLTPIKTINFPMQKEISSSQLSNIEDITLHYTGSTATVNGFYALYRGAAPSDDTSCCSIEFFDNNCNAKCRYKLDRKIFAFAVDEKMGSYMDVMIIPTTYIVTNLNKSIFCHIED